MACNFIEPEVWFCDMNSQHLVKSDLNDVVYAYDDSSTKFIRVVSTPKEPSIAVMSEW